MPQFNFDPSRYPSVVRDLLVTRDMPAVGLGHGRPVERTQLAKLTHAELAGGRPIRDPAMLNCCQAGLWLWCDFLDESHAISQQIETSTGSFWHGIMHRRELDFSNAKYWFRRVGTHPVLATLGPAACDLWRDRIVPAEIRKLNAGVTWDPFAFIDLCARVATSVEPALELSCQEIARLEWQCLFEYCWRRAGEGE